MLIHYRAIGKACLEALNPIMMKGSPPPHLASPALLATLAPPGPQAPLDLFWLLFAPAPLPPSRPDHQYE